MNRVFLIGRLTKEPEIREKSARYTLAVDRPVKAENQPEADFIQCVCFGKSVDFANKYLHKGMKIAIEGRIQTGSYEKDGHKVYTTDVIVDRHEFCESRSTGSAPTTDSYQEPQFTETSVDDGELPF